MKNKFLIIGLLTFSFILSSCNNNYKINENYDYVATLSYEDILDIKKDYLELNNITSSDPFNDVNFSSYYGAYDLNGRGYIFSLTTKNALSKPPLILTLGEYCLTFNDGLEPYLYYENSLSTLTSAYLSNKIDDSILSNIQSFIDYYEEYHFKG